MMQSYLFIGGNQNGRNIPLQLDMESIQLPADAVKKRDLLLGDGSEIEGRG